MYIAQPTNEVENKFIEILSQLAIEQRAEDGVINLSYTDIIDRSNNTIRTLPTVSGLANYYKEEGLLERIQRGTSNKPSKWDVSRLLAKHNIHIKHQQSVPQEPAAQSAVEELNTHEIQETLSSMLEYIKAIPNELVQPIENFSSKLSGVDAKEHEELKQRYESLEHQLKESKDEVALFSEELDAKEKVVKDLQESVAQLSDQLEESQQASYSEHKIYRSRNYILDEVERYLSQPGWARKSRDNHLRKVIIEHLDFIMKELGIHESTGL